MKCEIYVVCLTEGHFLPVIYFNFVSDLVNPHKLLITIQINYKRLYLYNKIK